MGFFTSEGDERRFYESEAWFQAWLAASPKSAEHLATRLRKATGHDLQFTAAELRPTIDWVTRDLRRDRSAVKPDWAYRSELGRELTMHGSALIDGLLVYVGGLADQHRPLSWGLDKREASPTYLDPVLGPGGPPVEMLPHAVAAMGHGRAAWDVVEEVLRWFDTEGELSYADFDTPPDVRESFQPKGGLLRKVERPSELPRTPASEALGPTGDDDPGLVVNDAGPGHAPGTPSDATHHAIVMLAAGAIDEPALLRFLRGCDAAPGIQRVAFRSHHVLEVWAPGLLTVEVLAALRVVARSELPSRADDAPLTEDDRRGLLLRAPFLERLGQHEDLAVATIEVGGFDATVTAQTPWLDDYTHTVALHPRIVETLTDVRMHAVADALQGLPGVERVLWEDAEGVHVHAPGLDPQVLADTVAAALR
ncbi:hypothetical protein [Demequina mangrovi]|uniref:Uncharacterized protein n=1 Tax=Demequina mangrovi TaxID=1043493 RepID=A0A1H7A8P8_9MICO|nr:hypothetical protein [Demequina mangrovi]SEJ61961.1 hypothetical protein SAMN05421637_2429 [Demequina mangrovi]